MTDPNITKAAKALSKLGASKGGKARAANLTPERRSEIAKHAATSRWDKAIMAAGEKAITELQAQIKPSVPIRTAEKVVRPKTSPKKKPPKQYRTEKVCAKCKSRIIGGRCGNCD